MQLTKVQRNELYTAIAKGGLDPATCSLSTGRSVVTLYGIGSVKITHKPSRSSFVLLDKNADTYVLPARIGKDPVRIRYAREWNDLLSVLTHWAQEVAEYERTPDLWAERKASSELVATIQVTEIDNAPFAIDEQHRIAEVLAAIRQQLRERDDLTPAQLASIERKLDDLVVASRSFRRKDWLSMLLAAGFSLIVNDLLPVEVVQHVVGLALRGVAHMFGVDLPLLPLAS